ncbi:MAG: zinc ribbon domain-containing protein [Promethearchaeota archaeon]
MKATFSDNWFKISRNFKNLVIISILFPIASAIEFYFTLYMFCLILLLWSAIVLYGLSRRFQELAEFEGIEDFFDIQTILNRYMYSILIYIAVDSTLKIGTSIVAFIYNYNIYNPGYIKYTAILFLIYGSGFAAVSVLRCFFELKLFKMFGRYFETNTSDFIRFRGMKASKRGMIGQYIRILYLFALVPSIFLYTFLFSSVGSSLINTGTMIVNVFIGQIVVIIASLILGIIYLIFRTGSYNLISNTFKLIQLEKEGMNIGPFGPYTPMDRGFSFRQPPRQFTDPAGRGMSRIRPPYPARTGDFIPNQDQYYPPAGQYPPTYNADLINEKPSVQTISDKNQRTIQNKDADELKKGDVKVHEKPHMHEEGGDKPGTTVEPEQLLVTSRPEPSKSSPGGSSGPGNKVKKFCPYCGYQLPQNSKFQFCPSCGEKI